MSEQTKYTGPVYDESEREWTWAEGCWGNEELVETCGSLWELEGRRGCLYDEQGDRVVVGRDD